VVAHVVERLDHTGFGQEGLHDLAGGGARVGEVVADAVGLPPVVHRVDDELAAQRVGGEGAVLAEGECEDDDVGLLGRLRGGRGGRAGRDDLDDERDLRRVARAGDEHAVARGHGEPREHGAHLAGPQDRDGGHAVSARMSRTMGTTLLP
jgi:hypothetical protein